MPTTTVERNGKKIKARYSSDCPKCNKPIIKDEHLVTSVETPGTDKYKRWVHLECKDAPWPGKIEPPRRRFRRFKKRKHEPGDSMKSRFDSVCQICGEDIKEGDPIKYTGEIWGHETCADNVLRAPKPEEPQPTPDPTPAPADPTPAPPKPGVNVDPQLFQTLVEEMNRTVELLGDVKEHCKKLEDRVADCERSEPRIFKVEGVPGDGNKVEGITHAIFEKVFRLAAARKHVFIPGPTGCGKTHLGQQLAGALGLRFGFVSCSVGMSEGHLTGRLLPIGDGGKFEYVTSEFIDCYENGGVFLVDEMDAADANVLLCINAALANGKMPVPNRPEKPYAKRHPDFVCLAAANTWGNGCDRQYVGRNQLDNATLDRFRIGQIAMDYDPRVEKKYCPDDDLRNRLQGYRQKAREARLERAISTRFLIDAFDMKQAGFTDQDIDDALFADWREDEIAKVK